jgi:hypothetical protein
MINDHDCDDQLREQPVVAFRSAAMAPVRGRDPLVSCRRWSNEKNGPPGAEIAEIDTARRERGRARQHRASGRVWEPQGTRGEHLEGPDAKPSECKWS